MSKRRYLPPLYTELRAELKRCDFTLAEVAEYLGCTLRAVNMKMSNIEGCAWRLNEMYKVLELIGAKQDELSRYFPKYPTRQRKEAV